MKTSNVLLLVFAGILVVIGAILLIMNNSNLTGQAVNTMLAQNSTSTTTPITSVPTTSMSSSSGDTYNVAISNFAFSPPTITIDAGDSIKWTNADSVAHTVISDTGNQISSPSIAPGQSYTVKFTTPGTYTYHCSIHPNMKGTIIVNVPSSSTSTSK